MTDMAAIEYLRSHEGAESLRAAAELSLEGGALLVELTRLRQRLGQREAAAVLEQVSLRRRAATKFCRADEMLFTPEGLEQASGETVAAHSAARYDGCDRVADLCCGIGGDLLALAKHARVTGYDWDPVRLACAEHNASAYGLGARISLQAADVEQIETPAVDALFFDPSRRSNGRRLFSLADYHPRVSLIDNWLSSVPAIGVKVAPGVVHEEVTWDCEQEFVAEGPDLKEGLLWFGPLVRAGRTATVLPSGETLINGTPAQPAPGEPEGWLYDPSPAVTRAGLVWELAAILGARQLDPELAYLSGAKRLETPFARSFPIESWMPFNLKRLKAHLRSLDVGQVEVRRRGAPIEPAVLERKLRQDGRERRLVFLTRMSGRLVAIICLQERA